VGNLHFVVQTDPWRASSGAAIAIRPSGEPFITADKLPSYVNVQRARHRLGGLALGTGRSYLCIQPGGKWGYDRALVEWLDERAPHLEDATFYISDEYAQYVEEWRIAGGHATATSVEPRDSHVGLYLLRARPELADFAIDLLADYLDGTMFFSEPEPTSVRARILAALEAHAPARWETWYHRGGYDIDRDADAAAVAALDRAVALAPDAERARVEVRLVRALAQKDIPRALAVGRAGRARWLAAAAAAKPMFNAVAAGLEHLAELEREHGDPAAAAELWLASARHADDDRLSRRFATIAGVRAAEGRLAEARDWLRAAILLEPELATEVPGDRDLAPLADPTLYDVSRDVDG
jgi:hypothetical protein